MTLRALYFTIPEADEAITTTLEEDEVMKDDI